ncbi:lysozyme inhibitor LprI family protein [Pseudomonas glycinae]|uniref:lysozyme inhibitor LprI family protein n=1 Tax=Pseudomonas glycinae TaxID=1785145 RepID=UPI001E3BD549|nr:lysozyme inhibitor LprI family protein [Pseudomonas glycinae]
MFVRFMALSFGCLFASFAMADDDCKEISVSSQVDRCVEAVRKEADSQLNASYKKLLARFESQQRTDPEQGKALVAMARESQRAWIKLRNTTCPLEATEIEPGMAAHVTTINNCMARMSLERAAYLDTIVTDEPAPQHIGELHPPVVVPSGDQGNRQKPLKTDVGKASAACPSPNFSTFLSAFSERAEVQKSFVQQPLKMVTTVAGDPEPEMQKSTLSGDQLKFPIIPDATKREAQGLTLTIKEEQGDHAVAILQKPDTDYVFEYRFVRGQCWQLEEVMDYSL